MVRRSIGLVAAVIVVVVLAGGFAGSVRAAPPPPPPAGTLGYSFLMPAPGNASLVQFPFTISGGSALPVPAFPTGYQPPAGLKFFLSVVPNPSGGDYLDALVVNPFPASGTAPTVGGDLFLWNVPPAGESLAPNGSGLLFQSIDQWPGSPPAACKGGALANRNVFTPTDGKGYTVTRGEMAVWIVKAQMQEADDLICDRLTKPAQDKALGLPYLSVFPSTKPAVGRLTTFQFNWGDVPGTPDAVLLTGFKTTPVLAGRDAKECKVGSRGTEHFAFCKLAPSQPGFILKMYELGLLRGALYKDGQEFGPFNLRF